MKKYLVIGNPINHSLSPDLHNYWIKQNNIDAIYEKKKIDKKDIENIILDIRKENLHGMNITVPYKKSVIPFLDELTVNAKKTQSVNTVYKENQKIIGDNTDIDGFEKSIKDTYFNVKNKTILILGSGGVVSSIVFALKKLGAGEITLSNRTKEKAENIKKIYPDLKIINWGEVIDFDVIINATSIGLKKDDKININLKSTGKNKLFYDVVYNPGVTDFLKRGKELGNKIENGKMMFVYQAQMAFKIWHKVLPEINNEITDLLNK